MVAVAQADNTYARIETLVRRLTGLSSASALPSSEIQKSTNDFYNSDFPNAIKVDQMRDVYTFYTSPYIDRYPLDVNYIQGVRAPVKIDGISGVLYKDRTEFYNVWPNFPSKWNPATGDGTTQSFSFNIPGPFVRKAVTIGTVGTNGEAIRIADDGKGNLQYLYPNSQTSNPVQTLNPAVPGMYNRNTGSPGLLNPTNIGTVDYVTGDFAFDLSSVNVTPASDENITVFVSPYNTSRPLAVLFYNNELIIRPIPKLIHAIEVEIYLSPVQFMQSTDSPILNQWVKYIAYGVSCEILRQRQDMQGVQMLMEGFKRQEALVLERQSIEEIGFRNVDIFSSSTPSLGNNNYIGFWGWD